MAASRFLDDSPVHEGGPYKPSQFAGDYISERHRRIGELVESVPGKLRHADELKLYEMAFMARGPILEIGTDAGRSLAIMTIASQDSGRSHPLYSVDISERSQQMASENLERLGLMRFVTLINGDSAAIVAASEITFDLAFVDGDHTYEGLVRDLHALRGKIATGGALVFHDYFDPRNEDPAEPDYGVTQAIDECREESRIRFRGGCGAVAVYEQL